MSKLRLGSDFEQHTMNKKDFENYKNNALIQQIIHVKEIDGEPLFYTIRTSENRCIGIYVRGIVTYLLLKNGTIFLKPNKMVTLEQTKITNLEIYKEQMEKIIKGYKKYQEKINSMKEKVFQHYLIQNMQDIKTLSKKYGKITIIDEELSIYLTKDKKRDNPQGRVDLVGVNEKGKLLFIEVKMDDSVLLKKQGINKHCYDIEQYYNNAKYKKEDLNQWIFQLNQLFEKNIPYIKNDNPDFIILCGYTAASKYDVIDKITSLISRVEIDLIKKESPNHIQVVKGDLDSIKTLKQHFEDIKKAHPSLILVEVKDNEIIKDNEVGKTRINYEEKSCYTIRNSLMNLIEEN